MPTPTPTPSPTPTPTPDDLRHSGSTGIPVARYGELLELTQEVDFSENALAAYGIFKVFDFPAAFRVLGVCIEVLTEEGATAMLKVGDATDYDVFSASVNANDDSVPTFCDVAKSYPAGGTLTVMALNDMDTAVIRITATGYRVKLVN